MKFTKKLYEGATLYGNDMYVKDIDVLPDATEFTTAPTLPRGTVALLSGYFRFRSVCLHVTSFNRYWINSYF